MDIKREKKLFLSLDPTLNQDGKSFKI